LINIIRKTAVTFEPLAQTWTVRMWRWNTKSVENDNNCIAASHRARAGVNPELGTDQFRYNQELNQVFPLVIEYLF
jgi:hypothetical protein